MEQNAQSKILLTVENVTKRFGGVMAVDRCSLHIRRGTITGLIGPNGAGKTTLFNIIAGVYRPDAGHVWFEGERIDGLPTHRIFARQIARNLPIARELKRKNWWGISNVSKTWGVRFYSSSTIWTWSWKFVIR